MKIQCATGGNYYFGTDGYNSITTSNASIRYETVYCERHVAASDSNRNNRFDTVYIENSNKVDHEDQQTEWLDYLFVILASENDTSRPSTNYNAEATPQWVTDFRLPDPTRQECSIVFEWNDN